MLKASEVGFSRPGVATCIGPFRHSDISVKAVNQHGGRVLIYCVRMLDYGAVT